MKEEILIYLLCKNPDEIEKITVPIIHDGKLDDLEKFCWGKKFFNYTPWLLNKDAKYSIERMNCNMMGRYMHNWGINYRIKRRNLLLELLHGYMAENFVRMRTKNIQFCTKDRKFIFNVYPGRIMLTEKKRPYQNLETTLLLIQEGWKIVAGTAEMDVTFSIDIKPDFDLVIPKDFGITWFRSRHNIARVARNKKVAHAFKNWAHELWTPPDGKLCIKSCLSAQTVCSK